MMTEGTFSKPFYYLLPSLHVTIYKDLFCFIWEDKFISLKIGLRSMFLSGKGDKLWL